MIQVKTFTATDTSDSEKEVVLEVDQQVNLFLRENKIQRNELISLIPTSHPWSVGNTAYFTHTIVLTIEVALTPELQVMAGTEQPYSDDDKIAHPKQGAELEANFREAEKYFQ